VRTHYPRTLDHEIEIMRNERSRFESIEGAPPVEEPGFMLELLAELTHLARRSPEISQRSGVSVRVSISNLEAVLANALKRAVRLGEASAAPRISDLGAVLPTTTGKIELETLNDEAPEERVVDRLLSKALYNVFGRLIDVDDLDDVVLAFEGGLVVETGETVASGEYVRWSREIPGFGDAIRRLGAGASPASVASAVEFLLEGLHLHRRLNKDRGGVGGGGVYRR
jgi:magnesium chelatase subunit I